MEEMEIDQIMDVPDTPDRFTSRCVISRTNGDNHEIMGEKLVIEPEETCRPLPEHHKSKRLVIHSSKNSRGDGIKSFRSPIADSTSNKVSSSGSGSLFRRASADRSITHETGHLNGVGKIEKGKAVHNNFPSKPYCQILDLTEENGQCPMLKRDLMHPGSKECAIDEMRGSKVGIGKSSVHTVLLPPKACNSHKGKEKVGNNMSKGHSFDTMHDKSIDLSCDSQQNTAMQLSQPPHSNNYHRVTGQKRLVRNGCISPQNIATKVEQLAEQTKDDKSRNIDRSNLESISDKPCQVDINCIVAEDKSYKKVKGKSILVHPSTSHAHDVGSIHPTRSKSGINDVGDNESSSDIRIASGGLLDGWRTTHNHLRNTFMPLNEEIGRCSSGIEDIKKNFVGSQHINCTERSDTRVRQSNKTVCSHLEDHATEIPSVIAPSFSQVTRPPSSANTHTKRQRKHSSASRNHHKTPASDLHESDVMIPGSSGRPSGSGSSRVQIQEPWSNLDFEVVELSPEVDGAFPCLDSMNDDDSEARARQLEADELLARELQEQLYHEEPADIYGRSVWENIPNISVGSTRRSNSRWFPRMHPNRQPLSGSYQNSNRQRTHPNHAIPNRMRQLRSRVLNHSSRTATSSRGRRLQFPLDMDLDMRLDILEALEAAVGDFGDMGMADNLFQVQRDFNENDYEMLLALDEFNHQHSGASSNQINNLPQSTIQTATIEEACAICLETPTIGETIRHLPCLHKFHKDCIDPWLLRRTSCPVCKSSIT